MSAQHVNVVPLSLIVNANPVCNQATPLHSQLFFTARFPHIVHIYLLPICVLAALCSHICNCCDCALGWVFAAFRTGVRVTSSWPTPRARDPGLHRNSRALRLNSSWQSMCQGIHAQPRDVVEGLPTNPIRRVWPRPAARVSEV